MIKRVLAVVVVGFALVLMSPSASADAIRFPARTVTPIAGDLPAAGEALYVFTTKALRRAQIATAADDGLRYLGVAGRGVYTFLRTDSSGRPAAWLAAQKNVAGTATVKPIDRVDADVLNYVGPVEALPHPLWIAVHPRTTAHELRALVAAKDLEARRLPTDQQEAVGAERIVRLTNSDARTLERLMESPLVAAIGFDYPKKLHNAASRAAANANDLYAPPYGLDGSGVVVGHWDGGQVDDSHPDFGTRVTNWEQGGISSHATHTAGTILGAGILDNRHRGFAPGATMVAFEFFGNPTGERRAAKHEFYHEHDNHSWGADTNTFGGYNQVALEFDLDARDLLLLPVKSAGNSGQQSEIVDQNYGFDSLSPDSTAKNALVVGATQDDGDLAGFSSRGPTNDGRIKPDLCANGQNLTSTYPNNSYGTTSGTSMSAPSVTGMLALLSELYKRENKGRRWAPDMIRAIMIHSAVDVFHPGPDYRHGWGNADALAAANLILADAAAPGTRLARGAVREGDGAAFAIEVPSGVPELKVTLSWLDAFVDSTAERRLLNDIDLLIVSPSGTMHQPFILDAANPFTDATRGVNTLDNVEQIVVDSPEAGTWSVWVNGTSISDPDLFVQGFVLASDFPIDRAMERIDVELNGQTIAIPDDDPAGLEIPFDIQTRGDVKALRVYVDVKHRNRGNIRIELTSPTDQTVVIETEDTSTRRDIYGIYPDLRSYDDDTVGLYGQPGAGRWRLRIIDVTAGETGEVRQAALEIDFDAATVEPPNNSPIADAGADRTVRAGATVQLDGTSSSDPDGDPITFAWNVAMGEVTLDAPTTDRPSFVAPMVDVSTAIVVRLTVDDGQGGTSADDVTVTVEPQGPITGENQPPIANAGKARNVGVTSEVVLDASASTDPDQDPLTFAWSQLAGPMVELTGADTVTAKWSAPDVAETTMFTFRVEVSDGRGGVDVADVDIGVDPTAKPTNETKTLDAENGSCDCAASTGKSRGSWSAVLMIGLALVTIRKRR